MTMQTRVPSHHDERIVDARQRRYRIVESADFTGFFAVPRSMVNRSSRMRSSLINRSTARKEYRFNQSSA
jgi:hypothetical protein